MRRFLRDSNPNPRKWVHKKETNRFLAGRRGESCCSGFTIGGVVNAKRGLNRRCTRGRAPSVNKKAKSNKSKLRTHLRTRFLFDAELVTTIDQGDDLLLETEANVDASCQKKGLPDVMRGFNFLVQICVSFTSIKLYVTKDS
jgi:hypothetical protein